MIRILETAVCFAGRILAEIAHRAAGIRKAIKGE